MNLLPAFLAEGLAFVDIETTGGPAQRASITEIGIVEVDASGVREWVSLVRPEMRIPPHIERLTGISNDMVAAAPRFEEVADEVYDRLWYGGARLGDAATSILRLATREDAVLAVHSFSKSYCMTGWRVGYLIARRDLARKATQLNEFIVSHAPSIAQKAAETALTEGEDEIARMLARLKENRDLAMGALRGIAGVTTPRPDGAWENTRITGC